MVLKGQKINFKAISKKETSPRPLSKMASAAPSQHSTQRSLKPLSHSLKSQESAGESDSDTGSSKSVVQSTMFKQFERMLQKALKQTSDHITDKLTKEIRELGQRTAELEVRVDEIENHTQQYTSELDNLKDENLLLQSRLEDQENRDRRSNLRIRGIPESIVDLQATMIALFQELQPGIPVERLEMDRVHRALAPRKTNGPPRDIIAKFHFFRTKEQLLSAARGNSNLNFQGHQYQLFTDLSPLTVAKRCAKTPIASTY